MDEPKQLGDIELNIEIYFNGPISKVKSKFKDVDNSNEGDESSFIKGTIKFEKLAELKDFNISSIKFNN